MIEKIITYKQLIVNKVKNVFFLAICLGCLSGTAQDIHNSQFWMHPVSLNPAAVGFFDGNLRIGGYNRTQWRSITKPYQTVGIFADLPLAKRAWKQDLFGFGVMMDYDQTGDSKFTTINGNMLFSYAHALNRRNNSFLMGGISLGCVQRSWDYTALSFNEQYVDGMFDPKSPISETFTNSNFWFFDCGTGLQWFYQPTHNTFYQAGFSLYHLNRPSVTMLADRNVRLPVRYVFHLISSVGIDDKNVIIPSFYWAAQRNFRETILGAHYAFQLPIDGRGYLNKLKAGLYYRWKDALFTSFGAEYRRCTFSIAYDFNLSKLVKASHVRGGVELGFVYIFKKHKYIRKPSAIPCTVFDR